MSAMAEKASPGKEKSEKRRSSKSSSSKGHRRTKSGSKGSSSSMPVSDINAHVAAYEGKLDRLRRYINAGCDIEKRDNYQATPLLLAAEKGHRDVVAFLLDNNADIKAKDEHMYTALHLASYYGRVSVVELLCLRGADVSALDDRGRTPRKLASRKEISKLLASKEREAMLGMDIHTAVEKNDVETVKQYIKSKGNLDIRGRNGMTPLHIACFHSRLEIVRVLCEGGCGPGLYDDDKDTPLHYACGNGDAEIISVLLTSGADPTALDGMGRTPGERNERLGIQKILEEESYKCIPRNLAEIRKHVQRTEERLDANESLFVQKAIGIKGLRLALQEKDMEVRVLKKKALQQDQDIKKLTARARFAEDMMKQIAAGGDVSAVVKDFAQKAAKREGCIVS